MGMVSLARERGSGLAHQVRGISAKGEQCWGSSEVLAMQRALNSARLLRKGLLGCQTAAGQHWYCLLFCMETLAFGSDAIFGNLEGRCFG